jgi:hypothetical protein
MVYKTRTSLLISGKSPQHVLNKFMRIAKKEKENIQPISLQEERIPIKLNWKGKPFIPKRIKRYEMEYYYEE